MNNLYFRVAEAGFRVILHDEGDLRKLLPSYAPFYVAHPEDEKLLFTLTIESGLVSSIPEGTEVGQFDSGDAKHGVYRLDNGGYLIYISNHLGELTCGLRTNALFSRCEVSLYNTSEEASFGLNNALMVAYAFSGAHHQRLLMHASVVMLDGYGYLFLGKSGTGKSTHSRLWLNHIQGTDLLNDDNPVVRYDDKKNEAIVYGSPWSGKTPCYRNMQVPVGGYLRLQQYPENIIRREPPVRAFASILSSCSTMIWDRPSYDGICDTVNHIAASVPAFHLQCLPDEAAAQLSHSHMAKKQ